MRRASAAGDVDGGVDVGMFRILWAGALLVVSDACRKDPDREFKVTDWGRSRICSNTSTVCNHKAEDEVRTLVNRVRASVPFESQA
jgi:hypothetical protein